MFIYHENQAAQNITKLSVTLPISTIHNIFKVAGLFVVLWKMPILKLVTQNLRLAVGLIRNEAAADDTCEKVVSI